MTVGRWGRGPPGALGAARMRAAAQLRKSYREPVRCPPSTSAASPRGGLRMIAATWRWTWARAASSSPSALPPSPPTRHARMGHPGGWVCVTPTARRRRSPPSSSSHAKGSRPCPHRATTWGGSARRRGRVQWGGSAQGDDRGVRRNGETVPVGLTARPVGRMGLAYRALGETPSGRVEQGMARRMAERVKHRVKRNLGRSADRVAHGVEQGVECRVGWSVAHGVGWSVERRVARCVPAAASWSGCSPTTSSTRALGAPRAAERAR